MGRRHPWARATRAGRPIQGGRRIQISAKRSLYQDAQRAGLNDHGSHLPRHHRFCDAAATGSCRPIRHQDRRPHAACPHDRRRQIEISEMSTPERYLIWSFEHRAWWGPGRVGSPPRHTGPGSTRPKKPTRSATRRTAPRSRISWCRHHRKARSKPTWPQTGEPALPRPSSTRTIRARSARYICPFGTVSIRMLENAEADVSSIDLRAFF